MTRPGIIAGARRRSGGGSYVAKAVHFDGATSLINSAISCTDNGTASFSGWVRLAVIPAGPFTHGFGPPQTFWVSDPLNTYVSYCSFFADSNLPAGTLDIGGVLSTDDGSSNLNYDFQWNYPSPGVWAHILGSAEMNHDQGGKVVAVYITDVLGTDVESIVSVDPEDVGPSGIATINGRAFYFGDDGEGSSLVGDVADWWIAPGVSLLSGGVIPEMTRRQFISASGKPVNPSGFPAGGVLFTGDASTFGTNQGSGGAFTTTGTLTNASTSPSD